MSRSRVLRLTDAIASALTHALETASDNWTRAELPPDWPVVEALNRVRARYSNLRLGVLKPFAATHFQFGCLISDVPSEITNWRNQPIHVKRENPTIILGDALKREESGLRTVPQIITPTEPLTIWESDLTDWIRQNIASSTPLQLFSELFHFARAGSVDAVRLDEYAESALKQPESALEALRRELWRVNLFPDERVLDANATRSRLEVNFEARQLLLAASDSPTDVNRLRRLHNVASSSLDAADQDAESKKNLASLALQYRETRDRQLLSKIELDKLFTVLTPRKPRQVNKPSGKSKLTRKIDLFDLLDEGSKTDPSNVLIAIEALGNSWDLEHPDQADLEVGFNQSGESPMDVRVKITPTAGGSIWAGDGSPASQMLTLVSSGDVQHDWIPRIPEGDAIYADSLIDSAGVQDQVSTGSKYQSLANDYITARAQLVEYERWLRESAFQLFLLKTKAREDVRTFLAAWHALIDAVNREEPGGADAIRSGLPLLEALWGRELEESNFTWCVLGPFHPYVLDPILRMAEYALSSIGQDQLGKKVEWALGRSLPSYRVLWANNSALFLAKQNKVFEFQSNPTSSHPPADNGAGIAQIARSFLGFHPFAKEALVITLIDPPIGNAIIKNLKRIQEEVKELRVYLVTTDPETSQLSGAGDVVRNLGRFNDIPDWLRRNPVKSHLVFNFTERAGDSSSPGSTLGSTPGAHVALRIMLENRDVFAKPPRYSPYVTFTPRDSNMPVLDIQRLSNSNFGAPRLFKTEPILSGEVTRTFEQLSDLADWAIIGVPSPLGLVAPRSLGGGRLSYLGREGLGPYGLYVYATSLFSVGKMVTKGLVPSPVTPDRELVEKQLTELALQSANSVLQIGLNPNGALWEQLGNIVSSNIARRLA